VIEEFGSELEEVITTTAFMDKSMTSPNHSTRLVLLALAVVLPKIIFLPTLSYSQGQVAAPPKPPEIHAILEKVVHPSRVKIGDSVSARLTEPTTLRDGTKIPKGTHILGKVTEIKKKADQEGPSKLGLLFDKAQLKDGVIVQLLIALVSVAPPSEPGPMDSPGKMASSTSEMEGKGTWPNGGPSKVAEPAMQPGVSNVPDIKIASVSLKSPGTILESSKRTVYLDSGSRLLLELQ
jgi:hypothetical protein